jgi:hypothetical protein
MFGQARNYTTKEMYASRADRFIDPDCQKLRFFNKRLIERYRDGVTEIRGKPGTLYLFLNDVWHGRMANKTGRKLMAARFGGFPTDFPFKDDRPMPEGRQPLNDLVRRRFQADQPVKSDPSVLVRRLLARHRKPNLEWLAHMEKKLALGCTMKKNKARTAIGAAAPAFGRKSAKSAN